MKQEIRWLHNQRDNQTAPSIGWADQQPVTDTRKWSYGCREEKEVLPERCSIRMCTFAGVQP